MKRAAVSSQGSFCVTLRSHATKYLAWGQVFLTLNQGDVHLPSKATSHVVPAKALGVGVVDGLEFGQLQFHL